MQKKIMVAVCVVVAVGLGFLLGARRSNDDLTAPVVRTYTVPADRTDEIKFQLNRLFEGKDGENYGRVQVFNNGLMIVRASEGYQRGVWKLVDQISKMPTPPRGTIHVDYWLVTGQEDKTDNASEIKALAPVLESISATDGARKFRVLEHLSTNSMTGQEVMIKGSVTDVLATTFTGGGFLGIKLAFKSKLGEIKSETQLRPGEFLVLGQNAVAADVDIRGSKVATTPANVYYIIRAELIK